MKPIIAASVLLVSSIAVAQPTVPEPGAEFAREEPFTAPDGSRVPAFHRPAILDGYVWLPAGVREDGSSGAPDYRPSAAPPAPDVVWEPGHVGPDRHFVLGFWRDKQLDGFKWTPGRYDRGLWVEGDFVAEGRAPRSGLVWSQGHVGPGRRFVLGFWRAETLAGFHWLEGYYLRDIWVEGLLRPDAAPPKGMVWQAGHVGEDRVWVNGFFRPLAVAGFQWEEGRYDPNLPGTAPLDSPAWVEGDFVPLVQRSGAVWEPGRVDGKKGRWVMGKWTRLAKGTGKQKKPSLLRETP